MQMRLLIPKTKEKLLEVIENIVKERNGHQL